MATVLPPNKRSARLLSRLFARGGGGAARELAPIVGPIQGELLGAEGLAERAREVARAQRVVPPEARQPRGARGGPLFRRLAETQDILAEARATLGEAADRDVDVSPAGEWLLDNYYVVDEHIREIRESMPAGYYRELPKLAGGTLEGYPRVYEVAIEVIAHTEGRLTLANIETFVEEFQRVSALTIGELWAIPAMLRLGLLENVRRLTLRTTQRLADVEQADHGAERLRRAGGAAGDGGPAGAAAPPTAESSQALASALSEFVSRHPPLTPAFVTRFLQQIRGAQASFPPLVWLEQWIADDGGMTAEDAAARSNQRLALTQVMMANSITSLRAIARLDWKSFVERQSVMERVLRSDPSGHYPALTFATRDHYRHVVERVAKRARRTEREVAEAAVGLARAWSRGDHPLRTGDERRSHVGFFLVDDGRRELERWAGYRPAPIERVHRWALRNPNVVYFGGIALATWAALSAVAALAAPASAGAELLVLALALLPASEVAIGVVNQLVTLLMPPRALPKLEFRDEGIPAAHRTAVVVPVLFGSVEAVAEAVEHLEVQYLANRDPNLHFALLSDFTDAPTETRDGDAAIVEAAVAGVRALNEKYAGGAQSVFYLLHRPRRWNERQGVWMGWERKRGKLAQFNHVLRGADADAAFSTVVGELALLRDVRYVITLDSDTVLPPEAAHALVGTIAHPLNRPVYDPRVGRVVRGYGILQPRVGVSLPSAHRSLFASIHSGHPGVDPYTTAVSDVYQDLFGEGSFTGKGIYDVDAFERATHGRFPENTLLSHDLIEGNYARAGLVTDVEVYDDYPARYLTFTRRKHRWIRGDWQLLRWLGPVVPGPAGRERNRLSAISRWKLLDNLRRSVVEIALLALLVAGWTVLPGSPLRWTAIALAAIAAPWVVNLLLAALRPPRDKSWPAYYAAVGRDAVTSAQQLALAVVFLPHQAAVSADAIVRTLYRLVVSKRNLLEWQTASQVERTVARSSTEVWRRMSPATALSSAIGLVVVAAILASAGDGGASALRLPGLANRGEWWQWLAVLPLVGVWLFSPAVAHLLSRPAVRRELRLAAAEREAALRYALLHWRYFDRFVGPETNWLAPDNFQEEPQPVVAPRTSPTNVGLQLLAVVSAHDLGFLTSGEVVDRLERVFRTLERLRRFRGHFYNWYDTTTLAVLEPAYVSTVDSGNLAGHLLALRQACLGLADAPVFGGRVWRALESGLALARNRLSELASSGAVASPAEWQALAAAGERVRGATAAVARGHVGATVVSELADVERLLRDASDQLAAAGLGPAGDGGGADGVPDAEPAVEWLAWGTALAAAYRAELTALGMDVTSLAAGGTQPGADGRRSALGARLSATAPALRELAATSTYASEALARLQVLADRARDFALEMDFRFLFDERRKLFAIGYNAQSGDLDASFYDLLASESRLASFIAIAKDDVPVEHWFRLGRTLTAASAGTALVSWSGSMFEYLMPLLVMQSFPFTLLDQTYQGAVRRQVAYGAERGVPWGISESAYNVRDRYQTYQYRAFGVPDLALKRGLGKELVVAPYATLLAVMVDPPAALTNARALEREGALGPFGFRDALDYTRPAGGASPSGAPRPAVIRGFFAHHVGMGLVALTNVLERNVWQRRFHADPMVRSAELILYERIPRRLVLAQGGGRDVEDAAAPTETEKPAVREFDTPDTPQPRVALLGNLPYTIMVSNAGSGYSRFAPEAGATVAVTRWRADGTRDAAGQWCYVKDVGTGRYWSAAHQPVCALPDWYRAVLATDRVVFQRRDGDVETVTEIAVVPDDHAEVRRVTVVNHGEEERELELTSYGEIVLAPPDTDRAHPAFANLFVETEWVAAHSAVLASRRPRSASERRLWCVHVAAVTGERVGDVTCETDRARFVGRGRSVREPAALDGAGGALSGTVGAVLDPVFALRARVRVAPGKSARVAFTTLMTDDRGRAEELADRYKDPYSAQRALDLAWTQTQVELRDLGISPADAALYQQLAGHLFYSHPGLRAPQRELQQNQGSQPTLWAHGFSGDWPILLALIDSAQGLPTLRQLLAAHHYWRLKGMTVDLVVLNTHPPTYLQELNDQLVATVLASTESGLMDKPGGVFIRRRDLLSAADLLMLRATARVHVTCDGLPLGQHLERREPAAPAGSDAPAATDAGPGEAAATAVPTAAVGGGNGATTAAMLGRRASDRVAAAWAGAAASARNLRPWGGPPTGTIARRPERRGTAMLRDGADDRVDDRAAAATLPESGADLLFDNGFGGLDAANDDYEIRLDSGRLPPAPWANVVATPRGGFCVTESGGGFAWAANSYFFRLTPWHNDPVTDGPTEVLYLRDEQSGEVWSATPSPVRHASAYRVRHGAGFSRFEHVHAGIATTVTMAMAEPAAGGGGDAPVKVTRLVVTNRGDRPRRLGVTSYVEWALGVMREHTQHQVRTRHDRATGAIFAQNFFDPAFAGYVAFSWMSAPVESHTADRREFLGRNGALGRPAAMARESLGGTTGAGFDPCAALRATIDLEPGETREIVVLLGAAVGEGEARAAIGRLRDAGAARAAAESSVARWGERLSVVRVGTPSPALDAMVNRWALYQALACRMWARSAIYQSSGAYGFRDQLQDVMAFVYAEPALAREHILRAAARQFLEGDVQHWWHPQCGRGVRTRFSDDLAWLPYVVDHYVAVTGDAGVLDAYVPFLTMRELGPDEHEVYDLPVVTDEHGSVYEHCRRALRRACTAGEHGLPLIGIGDWNDGMNRVGVHGRGESVWLAWFLVTTLRKFAAIADARGERADAGDWRARADAYARAVEEHGWDGAWYRRAYFDDGTPLGSALNDECRIDAIAQSWSVISEAAEPARAARAMDSLDEHLVREDARLIMLLTPAFDRMPHDPGYIKGYLPGVRENGAQYTHASLWAVLAAAMTGDGDRAFHLFDLLNPLTHARTPEEVATYKVEPYVVAADVYTAEGQLGRGGWTWYTGSASWLYRVALEAILGFSKRGERLWMDPCIPRDWDGFAVEYRHGSAVYAITVRNPARVCEGVAAVTLDGAPVAGGAVPLADDGRRHAVEVTMGEVGALRPAAGPPSTSDHR